MQGRTPGYDDATFSNATVTCRARVWGPNRELLAELPILGSEGVNADGASSGATRTFKAEFDGDNIPDSLDDLMAPGANRIQLETGLRRDNTTIVTQVNGPGYGWGVNGESFGVNNGLVTDSNGWLTLGG